MKDASGYDTFAEQAVQQLRDEADPQKIEDWLYVNIDEYEEENMSALPYEDKLKIVEDFFLDRLNGYYSNMDELGRDKSGKEWETTMHYDYGYFRSTMGVDGDHIDVFLSDNPAQGNVYVVDQVVPETGGIRRT